MVETGPPPDHFAFLSGARFLRDHIAFGSTLLLVLAGVFLYFLSPAKPAEKGGKEIQLLVEVPALADFLDDTATVQYHLRSGAGGVVLQPSTIGGFLNSNDLAIASGQEILRLFRMESILNIWMWEQLKGRPIRSDATYIFTSKPDLFENVLQALKASLGEDKVRPYRDAQHDFGGDVQSNYIIEVLAPEEEIRSLAVGLDRTYRQRLAASGLETVIRARSLSDLVSVRSGVSVLIEDTETARLLYARDPGTGRAPDAIYLASGVSNPGWPQAVLAARYSQWPASGRVGALIVSSSDLVAAAQKVQQAGYTVRRLTGAPIPAGPARDPLQPTVRALSWVTAWVGVVWMLFCWVPWDSREILARLHLKMSGFHALLSFLGLGLVIVWSMKETSISGIVVALFVILFPHVYLLGRVKESIEAEGFLFALSGALTLLVGELGGVGRPGPSPEVVALASFAVYLVNYTFAAEFLAYTVAAVALMAAGCWPQSALGLALMLMGVGPAEAVRERALRRALIIGLMPAGLALLARTTEPLAFRAAWLMAATLTVWIVDLAIRRRRPGAGEAQA